MSGSRGGKEHMTSSMIEVGGKERIDFREDRLMYVKTGVLEKTLRLTALATQ